MSATNPYALIASWHRDAAEAHRAAAAKHDATANEVLASGSVYEFLDAMDGADEHEMAEHPDLAELNAQMKGLYEEPGR